MPEFISTNLGTRSKLEEAVPELSGAAFRDLFKAKRIAVVGGSTDVSKIGGRIVSHILDHGYEGELLIVNPREKTSTRAEAFPSISAVPGNIDAALIVTPAEVCDKRSTGVLWERHQDSCGILEWFQRDRSDRCR